jgi:nucleoid DNA-binding protein
MARKLLPQEFYEELGRHINCPKDKAKFIWENTVEFIIDELKTYGEVDCPSLGKFASITYGGKNAHIPNNEEDKKRLNTTESFRTEYIDFYQQIRFRPSISLKETINNKIVTTSVWKRAREEVRKYKEQQAAIEKEKKLLEKKQNAMNIVRQNKLDKIHKQKSFEKLSKKKQKELTEIKSDWEEE